MKPCKYCGRIEHDERGCIYFEEDCPLCKKTINKCDCYEKEKLKCPDCGDPTNHSDGYPCFIDLLERFKKEARVVFCPEPLEHPSIAFVKLIPNDPSYRLGVAILLDESVTQEKKIQLAIPKAMKYKKWLESHQPPFSNTKEGFRFYLTLRADAEELTDKKVAEEENNFLTHLLREYLVSEEFFLIEPVVNDLSFALGGEKLERVFEEIVRAIAHIKSGAKKPYPFFDAKKIKDLRKSVKRKRKKWGGDDILSLWKRWAQWVAENSKTPPNQPPERN